MPTLSMRSHPMAFVVPLILVLSVHVVAQSCCLPPIPTTLPMRDGMMAVTFWGGLPPCGTSGACVVVLDPRTLPDVGCCNSNAPRFSNLGAGIDEWTRANLGDVFGVTIDRRRNVYVSATSMVGPAGALYGSRSAFDAGAVYRLDRLTGAICYYASLPSTPMLPAGTETSLGDICYDRKTDRLFVSDLDDGLIYSIPAGNPACVGPNYTQSSVGVFSYDHGVDGRPSAGLSQIADGATKLTPFGRRVFGLDVYRGRLYYGVWNEDSGAPGSPNEIWSVAIAANGSLVSATALREIILPPLAGTTWSHPPTDISFSYEGKMFVAERGLSSDQSDPYGKRPAQFPHHARVLEYCRILSPIFPGSSWQMSPETKFRVGCCNNSKDNAAGGVSLDRAGNPWVTGDYLSVLGGCGAPCGTNYIYGVERLPSDGNPTAATCASPVHRLIDTDLEMWTFAKTDQASVEVYLEPCGEWTRGRLPSAGVWAQATFGSPTNPQLVIGGEFTDIDGTPLQHIAIGDGFDWLPLGPGLNGTVCALTSADVDQNGTAELYAGGTFSAAGALAVAGVARWNGTTWAPLPGSGGLSPVSPQSPVSVTGIAAANLTGSSAPEIYVAGSFQVSGAVGFARWNGTTWGTVPGVSGAGQVTAMHLVRSGSTDVLYVALQLPVPVGNPPSVQVLRKIGTSGGFSPVGPQVFGTVNAIEVMGSGPNPTVFIGGTGLSEFPGIPQANILRIDVGPWMPLAQGCDGPVRAIRAYDDGDGLALFVGGSFDNAGGIPCSRVARWDSSAGWSSISEPTTGDVLTIEPFSTGGDSSIGIGGTFIGLGFDPLPYWGFRHKCCKLPTIVTSPVSGSVLLGGSYTFSVTATTPAGSGALSYEWFHNLVPIVGATQSTLTISPAAAADAGIYSVMVHNGCGCVLATFASLQVTCGGASIVSLANQCSSPLLLDAPCPILGSAPTVTLSHANPNSLAFLAMSLGVGPAILFDGGCLIHLDLASLIVVFPLLTDATGTAALPASIPADPSLDGLVIGMQGAAADPTFGGGFGLSNALRLTLGQ